MLVCVCVTLLSKYGANNVYNFMCIFKAAVHGPVQLQLCSYNISVEFHTMWRKQYHNKNLVLG